MADARCHGTTEEAPRARFDRDEASALQPLARRTSFNAVREVERHVGSEGAAEIDTNSYSVPWRLIGTTVRVAVRDGRVCIYRDGLEIAVHAEGRGGGSVCRKRCITVGCPGSFGQRRRRGRVPPTPQGKPQDRIRPCCGRWPNTKIYWTEASLTESNSMAWFLPIPTHGFVGCGSGIRSRRVVVRAAH